MNTMKQLPVNYLVIVLALACLTLPALAHETGDPFHTHDDAEIPLAMQSMKPRLEAQSTKVELLAVLYDGWLAVYADDYATNAPLENARILLKGGGHEARAQHHGNGVYTVAADWLIQPGTYEMAFTVETDNLDEVLEGTLMVPAQDMASTALPSYTPWVGGAVGGLFVLLLALHRRRRAVLPVIAMGLCVPLAGFNVPLFAADEETPGAAIPGRVNLEAINAGILDAVPKRLEDGSVFVPKPTQRLLGIRTVRGAVRNHPVSVALDGRVIVDLIHRAQVRAPWAGRIKVPEGGERSRPGEVVTEGQVLAYLEPLTGSAQPHTEALHMERGGFGKTAALSDAGLSENEALYAPLSGVIEDAHPMADGQLVEMSDVLFQIYDPTKLRVEALTYDPAFIEQIDSAHVLLRDEHTAPLTYLGVKDDFYGLALPMHFELDGSQITWRPNQSLRVMIKTTQSVLGIALPEGSVFRGEEGEDRVWLHSSAERFKPQPVRAERLLDGSVVVTAGVEAGARIVTHGAVLLDQIR